MVCLLSFDFQVNGGRYESDYGIGTAAIPDSFESYVVAVYHPSRSYDQALDYKIQATFKTTRRLCPFDCSGHGVCIASDGSSDVAAGVCACAVPRYVGHYCQHTAEPLDVTGDTLSDVIAYGHRAYAYVDVPAALNGSMVLVEMHKEEPLAFPMLFVRRGDVPSPSRYQYSPYVSGPPPAAQLTSPFL